MTGAPVPAGADAVLPAEAAEERDGRVLVREPVSPGRHVGRVGEDVARGREILAAGRRLRPQDVGLLASIGVGSASVVRRPRVAVLVTGNELLPPGSAPEGYRIADSNSPMLAALVARDGGECQPVRYLEDRYEAVRDAISQADADVVLVSGGSSVGREDHAPRAVAELGELAVHGVALRPASPTGVGFLPHRSEGERGRREKRKRKPLFSPPHPLTPSPPLSSAGQPRLVPVRLRPVRRAGGPPARREAGGTAVPDRDVAAGGEDRLRDRPGGLRAGESG